MFRYPKIQSPCPYADRLDAIMEGDRCSMCKRQVFDLGAMDDRERGAFLSGCSEEVCISYKAGPAIAAAAMAAATMAAPTVAHAQTAVDNLGGYSGPLYIIVGGITDPNAIQYIDDSADADLAELPVVYEDARGDASD